MSKMVRLSAFSFTFFLLTCSSAPDVIEEDIIENDPLIAFNDFPDSLFYGLYFGQQNQLAKQCLLTNEFVFIDSSGAFTYERKNDSTGIILPNAATVSSLKIMLKSQQYLQNSDGLDAIFSKKASRHLSEAGFTIYEYNSSEHRFKLTVFKQNEFIRLNFERRISK